MEKEKQKKLVLIGVLSILVLVFLGLLFFFTKNHTGGAVHPAVTDFATALEMNVSGVNPKPLQDFFVNNVRNNINDRDTKSAIYWITHRYFDNGGNIYEIYDFIDAHPEVAFLKRAENIYPDIFALIKSGKMSHSFSSESGLALLAYFEAVNTSGYGDIALWGIGANKYSEFALRAKEDHGEFRIIGSTTTANKDQFSAEMAGKALVFIKKAQDFLIINTPKNHTLEELLDDNIRKEDLLVGLNQYASAIQNFKGIGWDIFTYYKPTEIFEFNSGLAKNEVPRLYFFTNYLYATALVYGKEATTDSVRAPLSRVVEYAETTKDWSKSVTRVIDSKINNESGLFDYQTTKTLASLNADFKNWLKKNGWKDADFE